MEALSGYHVQVVEHTILWGLHSTGQCVKAEVNIWVMEYNVLYNPRVWKLEDI